MRKIIEPQMKIGEKAIANIKFDPRSRDEIPKLLKGLQAVYCNNELRKQVFEALAELIPPHIDPKNGRNGMELWKIFVLVSGGVKMYQKWRFKNALP
jgi:hypothetical protein